MWIQISTMVVIAAVAWTLANDSRNAALPWYHRVVWLISSLSFGVLALLAFLGQRERLNQLLAPSGVLLWATVSAMAMLLPAVALRNLLPRRTITGILLAGIVYGVGAIGLEFADGLASLAPSTLSYRTERLLEDSFEIAGLLIFLLTLARYQTGFNRNGRFSAADSAVTSHPAAFSKPQASQPLSPDVVEIDLRLFDGPRHARPSSPPSSTDRRKQVSRFRR